MKYSDLRFRSAALLLLGAVAPWKAVADPLPPTPVPPAAPAPPAPAVPISPVPTSPVPAPPVVETPDYPGAVWAPASPANFQPAQRPSPERPIDMIVIHDIEGTALSAVHWFQNPQAQASSHYVVDGHTGRVYQLIKEHDIAWHAGDRPTNARSVGIEHEGFAYRPGFYNAIEYEASARLVRSIALRYGIPRDRTHIIGHFEVPDSAHPGHFGGRSGHTDPGPYWDWDYFMALVRSGARAETPSAPPTVTLRPGETASAAFTLDNLGDDPWPADPAAAPDAALRAQGPVYLGTAASETDSAFAGPDWISPRFAGSPVGGDVGPGAAGRFVVPIHAPADVLGEVSETFRLYKVPIAPRLPVPFGPLLTVSTRIVPWDLPAPLPSAPPPGWTLKTLPGGARTFWRRVAAPGKESRSAADRLPRQIVLPLGGAWDVYVRSAPGAGRTARAVYQVTGAKGETTETVDQRTGGGQWRKLGRFAFAAPSPDDLRSAPGPRPDKTVPPPPPVVGTVDLLPDASAPGVLVAGDVRFVGPFPAASGSVAPLK